MGLLQAIVLGIVQGITEFLPISSSGHLVIAQALLGIKNHDIIFDVAVHLGTLLAILTIYRALIFGILKKLILLQTIKAKNVEGRLIFCILIASFPTAVIGLGFKSTFESLFQSLLAVGIGLIFTGFFLFLTRFQKSKKIDGEIGDISQIGQLTYTKAFIIGIAQSLAIAPGISRSGSTIGAALLLKIPGNLAASFSFMISIPAVLGAGLLQLPKVATWSTDAIGIMAVGIGVSWIFGIVGLKIILHFTQRERLEVFSYYLWLVGLGCIYWSVSH